jgi:tetratricopeptide (TPR) repeat protein
MPWYLKWMVYVIGVRGSKEDGLEHLKLALEKGQSVKNEAHLFLMVLYVREHRYAEALEIARHLNNMYPRSFLFALNVAQISRMSGRKEQALAMFLQVEKRVEAREPNFDKLLLQSFRFNMGVELMAMGQLDAAEERFRKSIDDPQTSGKERALSHLRLGQILDWKHRPKEAAKEYQTVLSLENFDGSHAQAQQLLKKLK